MMQPGGTLDLRYYLANNGALVELPPDATMELMISSITSEGQPITANNYEKYIFLDTPVSTYTNE